MNEKPVKVPIDFNEALRRIAKTPKSLISAVPEIKEDAAPLEEKSAAKVTQSKKE